MLFWYTGISVVGGLCRSRGYESVPSKWRPKRRPMNETANGVHMGCASSSKDVFDYRDEAIEKNNTITLDRLLHDQTGAYIEYGIPILHNNSIRFGTHVRIVSGVQILPHPPPDWLVSDIFLFYIALPCNHFENTSTSLSHKWLIYTGYFRLWDNDDLFEYVFTHTTYDGYSARRREAKPDQHSATQNSITLMHPYYRAPWIFFLKIRLRYHRTYAKRKP